MTVITIENDAQFQSHMSSNTSRLVVVDFTASWCGPCRKMAPIFEQMAQKYNKAVFLKVDVDTCQDIASAQKVSSMPTFIFFQNQAKLDHFSGSNPQELESKIKQYYGFGSPEESSEEDTKVSLPGYKDLYSFITMNQCEAKNNKQPLEQCLSADDGYMMSSCDNQLIISLTFSHVVKIYSIRFKAPPNNGPKTVKLFINQPHTLDFEEAAEYIATQILEIDKKDLESGNPVNLNFVKFQNVQNILIFIQDNQDGSDETRIDHLQLFGSSVSTTNMKDFKRVAGTKGEAH